MHDFLRKPFSIFWGWSLVISFIALIGVLIISMVTFQILEIIIMRRVRIVTGKKNFFRFLIQKHGKKKVLKKLLPIVAGFSFVVIIVAFSRITHVYKDWTLETVGFLFLLLWVFLLACFIYAVKWIQHEAFSIIGGSTIGRKEI